jgi:hypothetical protein
VSIDYDIAPDTCPGCGAANPCGDKPQAPVPSNLVNNLRKVDPQDITAVIHALGVAADEIERLRAALERIEALEHTDQSDYKKSLGSWAIAKDALESSPPETACRIDDKDIRMFLGWLSVELPELHAIETSRLGRAWEKWLELMHAQETPAPLPSKVPLSEKCPKCGTRMYNWPRLMTKCNKCLHEWYMDSSAENGSSVIAEGDR